MPTPATAAAIRARIGLLSVCLLVATVTAAAAQPSPGGASPTPSGPVVGTDGLLTVSSPPGYLARGAAKLWARETGTPVTVDGHASDAEVAARIRAADPTLDLAIISAATAAVLAREGHLAPIDAGRIPNMANIHREARALAHDPGNTVSVPYAWGTTGLCARTDLVPGTPVGWADLLSPADELSGRTTLMAHERWLLLPAQRVLGTSANTTDPAELEAARALLVGAAPSLLALDGSTFHERLVRGEAALVQAWDAWCDYAMADPTVGERVTWTMPAEGSDLWLDVLVIPVASPDRAAAAAFIDLVLRPKVHVRVARDLLYKVPNRAAMARLDADLLERFPNLGMTAGTLAPQEMLLDLGEAAATYVAIAGEVAAAVP